MDRREFVSALALLGVSAPAMADAQQVKQEVGTMRIGTDTPLATVHQYLDAFNRGDAEGMAATFAVPGQILDGMVPHVWQGRRPLRTGTETC